MEAQCKLQTEFAYPNDECLNIGGGSVCLTISEDTQTAINRLEAETSHDPELGFILGNLPTNREKKMQNRYLIVVPDNIQTQYAMAFSIVSNYCRSRATIIFSQQVCEKEKKILGDNILKIMASSPAQAVAQDCHTGFLAARMLDTGKAAGHSPVHWEVPELGFLGDPVLAPGSFHPAAEVDTGRVSNLDGSV